MNKYPKRRVNLKRLSLFIAALSLVCVLFAKPVIGAASYVTAVSSCDNTFTYGGQLAPEGSIKPTDSTEATKPTSATQPSSDTMPSEPSQSSTAIVPPPASGATSATGTTPDTADRPSGGGTTGTGDRSNPWIYIAIMLACVAVIAYLWAPKRNEEK